MLLKNSLLLGRLRDLITHRHLWGWSNHSRRPPSNRKDSLHPSVAGVCWNLNVHGRRERQLPEVWYIGLIWDFTKQSLTSGFLTALGWVGASPWDWTAPACHRNADCFSCWGDLETSVPNWLRGFKWGILGVGTPSLHGYSGGLSVSCSLIQTSQNNLPQMGGKAKAQLPVTWQQSSPGKFYIILER